MYPHINTCNLLRPQLVQLPGLAPFNAAMAARNQWPLVREAHRAVAEADAHASLVRHSDNISDIMKPRCLRTGIELAGVVPGARAEVYKVRLRLALPVRSLFPASDPAGRRRGRRRHYRQRRAEGGRTRHLWHVLTTSVVASFHVITSAS